MPRKSLPKVKSKKKSKKKVKFKKSMIQKRLDAQPREDRTCLCEG